MSLDAMSLASVVPPMTTPSVVAPKAATSRVDGERGIRVGAEGNKVGRRRGRIEARDAGQVDVALPGVVAAEVEHGSGAAFACIIQIGEPAVVNNDVMVGCKAFISIIEEKLVKHIG